MNELKSFTAGDHVEWSQKVDEPNYIYSYVFVGEKGKFSVPATLEGDLISVDLPSSETAKYAAGEYRWFLFGVLGVNRHQIDCGYINVVLDPTTLTNFDTSTFASRMLKAIKKRIEGRILSDHENYSIDGRSLSRIPFSQLDTLRTKYTWIVRSEKVNRGQLKKHRRIKYR
jgi:hypothetical protein